MKKPEVYWLNNPFDLSDLSKYPIDSPLTIQQWLDANGGLDRLNREPTVCVYKGKELMRSEYNVLIDEPVCFVPLPQGGGNGGSNPLMIVAMIALTVFTMGAGAFALGTMMTAAGFSSTAILVAQTAVMMAGSMLINAVFPPPGLPARASPSTASPTYSAQAQGNAARLGSPIPVNYGIMRIYPDFAANPYTEYQGNDQYLYQLFCIGQGEQDVHTIKLENTPLENFDDVTIEVTPPLKKVTLFHTAVVTAKEAGGQDLNEPVTLGPYIINNVDTEISRISVDLVFPGGLIAMDDDGDEYSAGVSFLIKADPIDDKGNINGAAITLMDGAIHGQTRTAIRRSITEDVPTGRYQVTIKRISRKGSRKESMGCQLGSVRGYLVDDNEYGDVTLLAIRIKATGNLSNSASRLVNCIVERKLPAWSPDDGWSLPELNTNPAWVFADAARSRYGGDFYDSEIDLQGLHYLAGLFDDRGDEFNGRFDTEQSLWDGLGKIGQVCRSAPIRQGNLLRMIRDQQQPAPVAQFSMANMSDFSLDFVMHNDRTADSVKVTYWDKKRDYAETTVLCQLPDENANNPKEVKLFGCTDYEQAWREGMYLAASNRDRRQLASWKTEMEGYIPTFGDVVWVNHDLLGAGDVFSGVVEQQVGDSLLLSCAIIMPGDNWYLVIRDRQGRPSQPIRVAQTGENVVRLLDTLPFTIEDDPYRERTHFMIGRGKQYAWPVKITSITPEADDRIAIAGCIESEWVHTADQGIIPPPPPDRKPEPVGLVIEGLISTQGGTTQNPVILLSWKLARGADRYLIELSRDGRKTWQPAGNGLSFLPSYEFNCQPGLITCRVAAVAAIRGEWTTIDVNAGGEFDKPGQVSVQLVEPFLGDALKVKWIKEPAAARYLIEVLYQGTRARAMYVDRSVLEYSYHWQDAQQDGAGRKLTVRVRAQNAENINGDWGEVTATNPPPAVPDGLEVDGLIDAFIVRADRPDDTDIREFRCYGSQTKGFEPAIVNLLATSQTPWINLNLTGVWYFRAAWVDQWGADDINFSGEVNGESSSVDTSEIQKEIEGINDSLDKIKGDVDTDIDRIENNVENNRTDLANFEEKVSNDLSGVRSDINELDTDITVEESNRIDADQALSKRITTVSANLSDETQNRVAAVKSESEARASEDEALGRRVNTVAADLSTETENRTAAITREETARAKADSVLAEQVETVASELSDETVQRTAAIKEESKTRAEQDQVLAEKITTVQSNLETAESDLGAAIKQESKTRADADGALGKRVDTVTADMTANDKAIQAALKTESEARASADGALGKRVDTVTASVDVIQQLQTNADFSLGTKYWSNNDEGQTIPENVQGVIYPDGVDGKQSLKVTGPKWIRSTRAFAVTDGRTYRVTVRVRQLKDSTTKESKVACGVLQLDHNYKAIKYGDTPHRYMAANFVNIQSKDGWKVFSGTISGFQSFDPPKYLDKFFNGTRYVRLSCKVNDKADGKAEALIDYLSFEDITETKTLDAAIQSEAKTRADADKATAEKIDTVQASLGEVKKLGKNPDFSLKGSYWSLSDRGETVPENLDQLWSSNICVEGGYSYWVKGKEQVIYSANAIPVDVNRKYKVRFRVRQWKDPTDATKSYVYAGVSCLGATYQHIDGAGTHHRRHCAANRQLIKKSDGWRYFEGVISGTEGSEVDENKFSSADVRFVRLSAYVNYRGGDGEALIDLLDFEDVTDDEALKAAVQVTSKAVATVEDGVKKLDAKWGVSLDVNGYCSGFAMNNDGNKAEALFRADLFAVGKPGVKSFSFVIDGNKIAIPGDMVVGGSITGDKIKANSITGDKIKANSVTASKINVNSLSAISANLGHATAGTFETNAAIGARVILTSSGKYPLWIGTGKISTASACLYYDKATDKLYSNNMQAINLHANRGDFKNVTVTGRIDGSFIQGTILSQSLTINEKDQTNLIPTDADKGSTPRFVTYENPLTLNTVVSPSKNTGGNLGWKLSGKMLPADYKGKGTMVMNSIYKGFERFKLMSVKRTISVSPISSGYPNYLFYWNFGFTIYKNNSVVCSHPSSYFKSWFTSTDGGLGWKAKKTQNGITFTMLAEEERGAANEFYRIASITVDIIGTVNLSDIFELVIHGGGGLNGQRTKATLIEVSH